MKAKVELNTNNSNIPTVLDNGNKISYNARSIGDDTISTGLIEKRRRHMR